MIRKRRLSWVLLFIFGVLLLGSLATGWNVVLVRDYYRILELAQSVSVAEPEQAPWIILAVGSLGFAAALGALILFFVKVLKEMRLNQLQAEFLATVSHELKTPIAAIELSSSLIQAGNLSSSETSRLWASHSAELKRLKSEVETLLEAARWQSNTVRLVHQNIELEDWLVHSCRRWKDILGHDAKLERVGDELKCRITTDPRMLDLVMNNLIDNARKFSKTAPTVIIRSKVSSKNWQIQIEDKGWGFDPAHSEKIFKRFFRSKNEAPYAIPGTGLGLFLAATASRALNISLRGESGGQNQGAIFTIEGSL